MSQGSNPTTLLGQTPGLLGSTADLDRNKLLAAIQQAIISVAGTTVSRGAWTPVDASGASLSLTVTDAAYTQIGNMVFAQANITYPNTASGANASIGGLPHNVANRSSYGAYPIISAAAFTNAPMIYPIANTATAGFRYQATGVLLTNANLSTDNLIFMLIYSTV